MDSLLNGNDDDPMTMLGSKLRPSIVPDIAREQGSLELSSRGMETVRKHAFRRVTMQI